MTSRKSPSNSYSFRLLPLIFLLQKVAEKHHSNFLKSDIFIFCNPRKKAIFPLNNLRALKLQITHVVMSSLRDKLRTFEYAEDTEVKVTQKVAKPKKKQLKLNDSKASTLALPDLPPSIAPGITIVFVGYNPGVESSKQQHHYAHFTNLFWKLFNASDILRKIIDRRNIYIEDHDLLKELYNDEGICTAAARHDNDLLEFGVGFTDLVLRCTKTAQELSLKEKVANVPRLMLEFKSSEAPFVVFIGKGIWEIVVRFLSPGYKLTKDNFQWGKQAPNTLLIKAFYKYCPHKPAVYVFPNTSGLVALMKYPEKLALWTSLVSDI